MEIHVRGAPKDIASFVGNIIYAIGEDDDSRYFVRDGDGLRAAYEMADKMERTIENPSVLGYEFPFPSREGSSSAAMMLRKKHHNGIVDADLGFFGTEEEMKYLFEEAKEWLSHESAVLDMDA